MSCFSAVCWNALLRYSELRRSCFSSASLLFAGLKCMRMKKRLLVGSPNCDESMMFKLCCARNPVTACTIPGRSAHDRTRMKLLSAIALLIGFL